MKKTFFLPFFLLLLSITGYCQSWQWAKSGGATNNSIGNYDEQVLDMATDKRGNVYVLARTHRYNIAVDGHNLGDRSGDDGVVVASWDCSGAYRWAKPVDSYNGLTPAAIGVDTVGGVYLFANFFGSSSSGYLQIGNDTTLGYTMKTMALIKLDTSGAYQWVRLPQADTVTYASLPRCIDMAVEENGTTHLLAVLDPGVYAGGQLVVPSMDMYILKYSASGQYTGHIKPQIHRTARFAAGDLRFVRDGRNGRYYFGGQNYLRTSPSPYSFNGTTLNHGIYLSAFNAQGTLLWLRQNTDSFSENLGRPAFDAQGNIYFGGDASKNDSLGGGQLAPDTISRRSCPFVAKLDANGNLQWSKTGRSPLGAFYAVGVAYSNGVIGFAGSYPGPMSFDSFRIANPFNANTDIFLARFDAATGAVLSLDTAKSPFGYQDFSTAITADRKGNFFVGGFYQAQLSFGADTLIKRGGTTDWWVAKFGRANCNCTAAPPSAAFTFSAPATTRTVTFTYSGTTAGLDSLVWEWGDGQRQVVMANYTTPLTHTYTGSGRNYNVCAKAYNGCGVTQSCKTVGVAMGVEDFGSGEATTSLSLAPNPANNEVSIAYRTLVSGNLEVYDVLGRRVAAEKISAGDGVWKLDVSSYVPGLYRVVLRQEGKVILHQSLSVKH